jgi:hypothetical protein
MQIEIEIPIQPRRMTLHKARALRDALERALKDRNDRALNGSRHEVVVAITAVALRFVDADMIFHSLHSGFDQINSEPIDFVGKRQLEQLHELSRFVAALEEKFAPGSSLHGRP